VKNRNENIGNRTRDLQACSAVPQLTATPRAPYCQSVYEYVPNHKESTKILQS